MKPKTVKIPNARKNSRKRDVKTRRVEALYNMHNLLRE